MEFHKCIEDVKNNFDRHLNMLNFESVRKSCNNCFLAQFQSMVVSISTVIGSDNPKIYKYKYYVYNQLIFNHILVSCCVRQKKERQMSLGEMLKIKYNFIEK